MIAGGIGFIFALAVVMGSRKLRLANSLFALTLVILPIVYMLFALWAGHQSALLHEFLWGIPFFGAGIACFYLGLRKTGYIVAAMWFLHLLYDVFHDQLFTNAGVPGWYPALCAGFDLVIILYIVYLMRTPEPDRV